MKVFSLCSSPGLQHSSTTASRIQGRPKHPHAEPFRRCPGADCRSVSCRLRTRSTGLPQERKLIILVVLRPFNRCLCRGNVCVVMSTSCFFCWTYNSCRPASEAKPELASRPCYTLLLHLEDAVTPCHSLTLSLYQYIFVYLFKKSSQVYT